MRDLPEAERRLWSNRRPNWTPIHGNCNAQFYIASDAWVRCTGIAGHDGLHRCHYDTGPQQAMFMWGDEKQHTALAALVDTDPLALVKVGRRVRRARADAGSAQSHRDCQGDAMTTMTDVCGIHGTAPCPCLTGTPKTYADTYPLDFNGYVAVSRPFERVRADEVRPGDILILDSGLSRVTHVTPYRLDNGVAVVHITGPTNVVRADYEVVTVLR